MGDLPSAVSGEERAIDAADGWSWGQVAPPRDEGRPVPIVVPWLLVLAPMLIQFQRLYDPPGLRPVLLAVGLTIAAFGLSTGRLATVVGIVAGGLILLPEFGAIDAGKVWVPAAGVLLLLGYALRSAVLPIGWVNARVLRPSLVLLVPAAILLIRGYGLSRPAVFVMAAWLTTIPLMLAQRPVLRLMNRVSVRTRPWTDRLEQLGKGFGRLLALVVLAPAGLLIMLVWVAQRLLRVDPLATVHLPGGNWSPRSSGDPQPQWLFSSGHAVGRKPSGYRARTLAASAIVVVAVATGPALVALSNGSVDLSVAPPAECLGPTNFDAAMHDDPAWPKIACEFDEFASEGRFDAVTTYAMVDYEGDYVNVIDGARETWRQPPCDCERVSIWFFGGSAAFGWWQRDEFSPPSQLAKAAWERGIALDITTIAMPGWVLGQEARAFGQRLSEGQEPPDLAIFYDGGNELNRQYGRNAEGRGADESPTAFAEEEINVLLASGMLPWQEREARSDSIEREGKVGPEELADHAMNRYLRDVDLATRLADSAAVDPVFVWQPLLGSAPARVSDPEAMPHPQVDEWRIIIGRALEQLPEGTVDLSNSLDDADRIVFKDLYHTNEYASAVVGEALFEAIRPRLERAGG